MEIGDKIQQLRKNKKLTQEQLAEELDVARQTISKWELGETYPDINQAKRLSQIFNISLDELVNNNTKEIIVEKVSNTEKLAGMIIKILKVLGIIFIAMVVIEIIVLAVGVILFVVPSADEDLTLRKDSRVQCTLNDEEYLYEFTYNEKNGHVISSGGDAYLNNITDIEEDDDIHQILDKIDAYFENNGGYCEITNY